MIRLLCASLLLFFIATTANAQILDNGIPNIDDERLYAWYDGNDALGADGVAETPIWPDKKGNPDRDITNGFGGNNLELQPVEVVNGQMGLRYTDVVTWRDAAEWGLVADNFTVFVAATVRDPNAAYFFTGNQGGGGAEANANFQTIDADVWSMKGEFREDTVPLVVDEFQFHSFVYTEDGLGLHYINGELKAQVDIGSASLNGFVLGGRQNGNERASVDFGEVIIYDDILNDVDRQAIEAYLNEKFFGGVVLRGDFNNDGVLDAADINDLTAKSAIGSTDLTYDLTGDGSVNGDDVNAWISGDDIYGSWPGDADLDLEFNSGDLVAVLSAGKYEVDVDAVWTEGDFNGDGRANSGDLVTALSGGGYELGPKAAVAAVPEPASATLLLLGVLMFARRRRK